MHSKRLRLRSARALLGAGAIIAGLVAGLVPAAAQPASGAQESVVEALEKPSSVLGAYGFRGSLTYKNYSFFQETPNDDRNFYNEGIVQLEWARRLAPWFSLKLVGEARADTAGYADGVRFEIPDTPRHRSWVALKEAVAEFRGGPFELSLGKQFYAWGTADVFNPTDNLNPRDYMDPIDSEKMAVYSLAARVSSNGLSLTFVVVPAFTPSRLPLGDSRWAPPVDTSNVVGILAPRDVPAVTFDNIEYAARLRWTIMGWDVSASYFEGYEYTPVLKLSQAVIPPGVVVPVATPVFTRMRVPGFDFSTTWRKFEFHGEGAFKLVQRDGRNDRFQFVAGLNYTFDEFGLRWLDRILVIAEYGKEWNIATHTNSPILSTSQLQQLGLALPNNAIRDSLAGRVAVKFTEDTELKLTTVLDFTSSFGAYTQVKLTHRIIDALVAEGGLDFFNGERGKSFWGQWRDNDRFFFTLKYFF